MAFSDKSWARVPWNRDVAILAMGIDDDLNFTLAHSERPKRE